MNECESLYEVVVGNVGYVYTGYDKKKAENIFDEYARLSKNQTGKAAGEHVILFRDCEPAREYIPTFSGQF